MSWSESDAEDDSGPNGRYPVRAYLLAEESSFESRVRLASTDLNPVDLSYYPFLQINERRKRDPERYRGRPSSSEKHDRAQ